MQHHSKCPSCGIAWEEEETIEEYFLRQGKTPEEAKEIASHYAGTHFGKNVVGIETDEYDGVSYWYCKSCDTTFNRWTMNETNYRP